MPRNVYAGLIEPWKLRIVKDRARRRGYRGDNLDEVVHRIVLELVDFQFVPRNGAAEATAITALVDRQLSMYHRNESRYRDHVEKASHTEEPTFDPARAIDRAVDVREALAQLPEPTRRVCELLAGGLSINEAARELGVTWHTANRHVQIARAHFKELGFGQLEHDGNEEAVG